MSTKSILVIYIPLVNKKFQRENLSHISASYLLYTLPLLQEFVQLIFKYIYISMLIQLCLKVSWSLKAGLQIIKSEKTQLIILYTIYNCVLKNLLARHPVLILDVKAMEILQNPGIYTVSGKSPSLLKKLSLILFQNRFFNKKELQM